MAIVFLSKCNSSTPAATATPVAATPKAFEEKLLDIRSYDGYEDMVDKLYEELMATDASLKSIEAEIKIRTPTAAALKNNYRDYNSKSISYYKNAHAKIIGISDSVLKHKLQTVLEKSAMTYESKNSDISSFLKALSKNDNSIKDKHIALKVLLSLEFMENFQKTSKPQLVDYSNAIKAQTKLMQRIDSIAP